MGEEGVNYQEKKALVLAAEMVDELRNVGVVGESGQDRQLWQMEDDFIDFVFKERVYEDIAKAFIFVFF